MSTQAVVLLSGGLDSVFNLYAAHTEWSGEVLALSINYGQKAWDSELRAATTFSEQLGAIHEVLDISSVFSNDQSSLTSDNEIPTSEVNIESVEASEESAKKVWVSNRNGVLLNIAATVAEKKGAQYIVPGFNKEEAATFPDNSIEYIEKMNACLKMSTSNGVQIQCFSQDMNKTEIVNALKEWNVNFENIWPCYYNGEKICGRCESCQRFLRAVSVAQSEAKGL